MYINSFFPLSKIEKTARVHQQFFFPSRSLDPLQGEAWEDQQLAAAMLGAEPRPVERGARLVRITTSILVKDFFSLCYSTICEDVCSECTERKSQVKYSMSG